MIIGFVNRADYKRIKQIYFEAFPKHERVPFFMLKKAVKKGKAEILTASEMKNILAFAYVILYHDLVYVFYFAVIEELRDKGIGSVLLKYLLEHYEGKRIFLAVEQLNETAADNKIRVRRKSFYIRNGFKELEYKIQEKGTIFDVLATRKDVSILEYKNMFYFFGGKTFDMFMKIIFLV